MEIERLVLLIAALLLGMVLWLDHAYAKKKFPFSVDVEQLQVLVIVWTGYGLFVAMLIALGSMNWTASTVLMAIVAAMFRHGLISGRA